MIKNLRLLHLSYRVYYFLLIVSFHFGYSVYYFLPRLKLVTPPLDLPISPGSRCKHRKYHKGVVFIVLTSISR